MMMSLQRSVEEQIEDFDKFLEVRRITRLSRGNVRVQNGFFLSTAEQQRRQLEHPETLRELNRFLSKRD